MEKNLMDDQNEFFQLLELEDRAGCINYALEGLDSKKFNIPELYENIMGPSLSQSEVCSLDDDGCIWREHIKTAIIRTVIECCWTRVDLFSKNTEPLHQSALVLCPEKEMHEIGARMAADFFSLVGYKSIFIGANTPREQIKAAVIKEKPAIVAVSVTDFYHLVEAEKAIHKLKEVLESHHITGTSIFVGGYAFKDNPDMVQKIGANGQLQTFQDIAKLARDSAIVRSTS